MAQPVRKIRKGKIEPFDYSVAAHAPALKGMTSFLEISPSVLRETSLRSIERPGTLIVPDQLLPVPVPISRAVEPPLEPVAENTSAHETTPGDERASISNMTAAAASVAIDPPAVVPLPVPSSPAVKLSSPGMQTEDSPEPAQSPVQFHLSPPGDERSAGLTPKAASAPGVGRSKVRRCMIVQDGHSLGEEAIYQILWKAGEPEDASPQAARIVELGAAEIGIRSNMAKKNVRQNLSRLYEKLSIEILEDFHTSTSRPRKYRVLSYRQILDRRRSAGLEYVMRNKGVVFCTSEGVEIDLARLNLRSPGDERSPRPAQSKRQRIVERRLRSVQLDGELPLDAEVAQISELINRHWTADEEACRKIILSCRQVRPDARMDEILFFLEEKIGRILQSRGIGNPVGLLLATMPRCFAGATFENFRLHRSQRLDLKQNEEQRRQEEEAALQQWLRDEVAQCQAILDSETATEQERNRAETRLRGFASWNL